MYRMNEFAVAIRTRGHVTLYADNVYVDNINRYVRLVLPPRLQYTLRRESQQRSNVVGFVKVYSESALDLALHRIVISTEHYRVFYSLVIVAVRSNGLLSRDITAFVDT